LHYDVLLNGRNFLIETEGEISKYGFFVLVYVEANDRKEAELKAVQVLKGEENLRTVVKNEKSDTPLIFVEEIIEYQMKPKAHKKQSRTGFGWYKEGEEEAKANSREAIAQMMADK
jgi:hypothetical protein